ncbi:sigma-70 family RNA polymerase sigma factor [Parapedobacter sp. ISTM3]|uniref:RNA polymerase sigma-70 factor, ECF subfamily n=1 Tax=Parapedobacter luteus TaxID=623280 RepID=A0A1T5FIB2_9SPHI|nr:MULTISPECIES: sigma-70 family RNA polymerase sigma factor [Parapedobacter]MBK1440776.1 sigma-70 family RNA polymerase sigma factor [Parapedobacter sp. ISTM3]SKB95822.1 RNA polymerase sigma-70 factor, ECF subfamily [Parapedobacter luteus]
MKPAELKALVDEMAASNSESAYRQVFDQLFLPIRKFSYSIVKSWEVAEEVASDVLFMLWQQRRRLADVTNIRYYAFVAARNHALNALKKQAGKEIISLNDIEVDIQLATLSPEAIFLQGELQAKLEHAIALLPKQCKLVFKLIKEDGLSYKEVADLLGLSPKTVDAHLVNAMKKLAAILKAEFKLV